MTRRVCIPTVAFVGQTIGVMPGDRVHKHLPNAALYWDQVTVPIFTHGENDALDADIDALEGEGVAIRWQYKDSNSFNMQELADYPQYVVAELRKRMADTSADWSFLFPGMDGHDAALGLTGWEAFLSEKVGQESIKSHSLSISFMNALPVCPPDTPIKDIISFKKKRSDHLSNLHEEIDFLAASLSGADDLEDAVRAGRSRVEGALLELDKVFSERWSSRMLGALRTNTGSIVMGALGGAAFSGPAGFSLPLTTLAGGAAAAGLEAVFNQVMAKPAVPDRVRPYLYAIEAQRELRR
ncbi:DUF6236 family protein [Sphingomonas faeni]|uniref:DUF6236 family protein n=1 Tax=Sphingomonas faeni TaxID=185950 RepID=UPI0033639E1B